MLNKIIQYGVGIDVDKQKLHAHFMVKMGCEKIKIIAKRKFDNTPSGRTQLVKWIEQKRKDKALIFRIYLEVTGVYHEHVLEQLHSCGYWVSLILAKRVKAYGVSIGEDSKTDPRDSYKLGHMALSRKEKAWQPLSKHILEIRSMMRHRKSLMITRISHQNQLHALKHSAFATQAVKNSLAKIIKLLNKQIGQIEKTAIKLAKQDTQLFEKLNKIVTSVDGVGLLTMLVVISETNGFSEFNSISQLIKYAGYDIIENQSGKRTGKTRISKNGNATLRAAMYMPVLSIIRTKKGSFYALYRRVLEKNPGISKKAQVALQRKLLTIIYTLWKKEQAFDPNYKWRENQTIRELNTKRSSSNLRPELHGIAQNNLASIS